MIVYIFTSALARITIMLLISCMEEFFHIQNPILHHKPNDTIHAKGDNGSTTIRVVYLILLSYRKGHDGHP